MLRKSLTFTQLTLTGAYWRSVLTAYSSFLSCIPDCVCLDTKLTLPHASHWCNTMTIKEQTVARWEEVTCWETTNSYKSFSAAREFRRWSAVSDVSDEEQWRWGRVRLWGDTGQVESNKQIHSVLFLLSSYSSVLQSNICSSEAFVWRV